MVLATELTARMNSGALLSEYSTNTSSSFRAVFTTKRDWGEGSPRVSGAGARPVLAPDGEGKGLPGQGGGGAGPREDSLIRKSHL